MMMNVGTVSNLFTTETDRTIKKELDKEAFLRLLTTQLKNQDPLEPMKDQDFIAQMSQLSSVEQIMNMSKSVQTFVETASQLYRTQAVSMIGKTAVVKTNTINVEDSVAETKVFNLDSPSNIVIRIYDSDGKLVREERVGQVDAGMQLLAWDGKDQSGTKVKDGKYVFEVLKANSDGTFEEIPCVESGVVSGVRFDGSNIKIVINDVVYDISQISEIYA
ncbi:MAG TPA: flagellar hook capping FlgD N-terminal domain-containing protein [Fervidobacterium sp.]|mgnify:CR=1 FL=1|nr:flagellar hook capping FlgD N-terminal domain-containing protein [Fervidobacterium sp.]HPT53632.1 flagellar hook capping FlgD N-terminal domain-containing protein [Fervidobacterium sp.]HPZ18170.1 flagellar hook capping FlgD N-terminal domain-containing protein [Fervidobacterium sp.]HQE48082.1 flagellar hook capping FlgD N-terminal domain-containing protein [Fervidobacterium sp.]HUM41756.1 flagellar hook capping FlgD N-terminal domain-containing protein [Fervidobacterium sp.]